MTASATVRPCGDSDTLAAITGSIAEAKWGVPEEIGWEAERRMDAELFETNQRFVSRVTDWAAGILYCAMTRPTVRLELVVQKDCPWIEVFKENL